jgi:hypothetical protein
LPAAADQAVARHLEACWTCRARFDELQRVIRTVARFRNDILLPSAPPPPCDWPGLEPALSALDERPPAASFAERVQRLFHPRALRLRLAWAVAGLALVLALAALDSLRAPVLSDTLLEQSGAAERALVDAPTKALRRVVQLEERRASDQSLVGRRRIEIWRRGAPVATAAQAVTRPRDTTVVAARRVFDERDRLVAGEWTSADGSRTVYRSGQPPETVPASARPPLDARDIWRLDPSARDFLALVGRSDHTTVEQRPDGFVVRYRPPDAGGSGSPRLVEARLTIRKEGLRVTDQVLVVLEADVMREYRFAEKSREQLPADRVQPAVFVPEEQLAGVRDSLPPLPAVTRPVKAKVRHLTDAALDAMEMTAWQRLHQARLCSSELASVSRTGEGVDLRVAVESEARRDAIRQLLGGFGLPSAIRVDLTVAAPPARQAATPQRRARAHALLRAYLSGQVARWSGNHQGSPQEAANDPAVDAAAQQMADWAVERSARTLAQARALQKEADRWPAGALRHLDLDAVSAWQSMITDHAREILQDVGLMRAQFEPVLFPAGPPRAPREDVHIQEIAHVEAAAARVLELAISQHRAVEAAFSPAAPGTETDRIDGEALWWSWRALEKQAQEFTAPWVLLRPGPPLKE